MSRGFLCFIYAGLLLRTYGYWLSLDDDSMILLPRGCLALASFENSVSEVRWEDVGAALFKFRVTFKQV